MRGLGYPIFDLDGTLLDSDDALTEPFLHMGVPREEIVFGRLLEVECARLGLRVADYLDRYDDTAAAPFPGVHDLVARLDRWAVCSNKHPRSGRAELDRLGWTPDVAMFSDAFGGEGKRLEPVLSSLGLIAEETVFVGDTEHDRRCADDVGSRFVLAGWNPRADPAPGDIVVTSPSELAELLA